MAASKPTSSLSLAIDTFYPLTLNRNLGTLTAVWVDPLTGTELTPDAPFPCFYAATTFGVGQRPDSFRSLKPQSVSLQSQPALHRLDCRLYRKEPAITVFDGLFTPSPKSEERLSTEPLQASTQFYPRFTLPRARSYGFGSHSSNSRHFHTSPLIACGLVAFASAPLSVNLAAQMHSLARYSKRTLQPRRAATNYS